MLKPKHSGFFDTTLDTLLETLRIRRVILTGIAGNICVLFTANDAYMRDLKIFAPADCIVSNTAADNDHALRQIETVLKGERRGVDAPHVSHGTAGPESRSEMSYNELVWWIRDRGLTLLLVSMFALFLVGQFATGFAEYNAEQQEHGQPLVTLNSYLAHRSSVGGPVRELGKRIPADGGIRPVDHVPGSEGIAGIQTARCEGTRGHRSP